jgi:3-phosphoshikimate 1-carboxyvinyltransferase
VDVRVYPCDRLEGVISPPSSKNYTTRYLLAAALANGESVIRYVAHSEDSEALQRCLLQMGAALVPDGPHLRVRGFGRRPRPVDRLNPGNAGAVLRFLMGVAGATLPDVTFVTEYAESLGKRPQGDLIDALQQLGVRAEHDEGRLPVRLRGGPGVIGGGRVTVSGAVSSQFTSALLIAAPLTGEEVAVEVTGELKSLAPIRQTLQMLGEAGVTVEASADLRHFRIPGGQHYQPREYEIPGDYPGSSAVMAAAAILPSDVTILRLRQDDEQGEQAAVSVLAAMGADIRHEGEQVRIRGGRPLRGVQFDGDRFTDAVLALTAAAVFADGTTRFYNVGNIRFKECDRISDYRAELLKTGARVDEERAALIVHGQPGGVRGGATVDARIDHRVVMGLTVVGLGAREPLLIRDAHHVAKSYPAFFADLRSLGARIEEH